MVPAKRLAARASVQIDRLRGDRRTMREGRHFGTRLREARLGAGFSQSELEELSGIPKARLSRYENGHVEPSIQTLARLSKALNVSEASLLTDERGAQERFLQILADGGVTIETKEQAERLGNEMAAMVNPANPAAAPSYSSG
jgi:transcriptional regulator with XRE-family HTH domain